MSCHVEQHCKHQDAMDVVKKLEGPHNSLADYTAESWAVLKVSCIMCVYTILSSIPTFLPSDELSKCSRAISGIPTYFPSEGLSNCSRAISGVPKFHIPIPY